MTQVTAIAFKAAVATAAADITTAWSDTILTEVAAPLKSSHHPLRQVQKLFIFNASTGVVTANDAYIDAAYAGLYPNKGSGFDKNAK